jgi:hypothetical protein
VFSVKRCTSSNQIPFLEGRPPPSFPGPSARLLPARTRWAAAAVQLPVRNAEQSPPVASKPRRRLDLQEGNGFSHLMAYPPFKQQPRGNPGLLRMTGRAACVSRTAASSGRPRRKRCARHSVALRLAPATQCTSARPMPLLTDHMKG